jgi:hypothetical protein
MKPVDYAHFGRFVLPHTLAARGDSLYFCEKTADFEENKYRSDLFVLRTGAVKRLTASGDAGEYHLLDSGIVFASTREKKDRERADKGIPLTVLQRLPYDGGEAEEFLRLPFRVTGLWFRREDDFFFTAACSREWEAALAACGGDEDKAAERLRQDEDYRVLDEVPFAQNGSGYTNGVRSRLFSYRDGQITPVTEENENVSPLALSPDGKTLWYAARRFAGCDPFYEHLYALDAGTLAARDISVADRAEYQAVLPFADGSLAVLASLAGRYGINENARVFRRGPDGWEQTYGAGEHDFYGALCSDICAGRAMAREPVCLGGEAFLLDTQDDSVQIVALEPKSGAVRNVTREKGNITDLVRFGKRLRDDRRPRGRRVRTLRARPGRPRDPAHGAQHRARGGIRLVGPAAAFVHKRARQQDLRLGHPARGARGGPDLSRHPRHPRRPQDRLRRRLFPRDAALGQPRLFRCSSAIPGQRRPRRRLRRHASATTAGIGLPTT